MNNQSNTYIRKLVITGSLGALSVFLGITRLGLIPWFSGVSITILHIPAIIGAILEGPIVGMGIGAIFGLFSLYQANISPIAFDALFRNPLVSVLPRVLFPIVAWAIFRLLSKRFKIPAVILASVLATIVHTIFVLSMLVFTAGSGTLTGGADGVTVWAVIGSIVIANGIPEAIAAGIITTLVVAAWLALSSKNKKAKLNDEA